MTKPVIKCVGKTDIGLKRTTNEDAYCTALEMGFCLVADGLGGAAAGEVASQMFSDTALEVFSEAVDRIEVEVVGRIKATFRLANERIQNYVRENPTKAGMGCTADLFALSNEGFVIGHIGDSRSYRFRKGQLKQLTKDHSLVQSQIDQGLLSIKDAKNHPMRHVVLRALGTEEDLALDLIKGRVYPEDQFLLCSDGLTTMVDDMVIQNTLSSVYPIEEKAEHLINQALSAGGMDNVTIVLIEAMQ
jgi:protein phosphatase